MTPKFYGTIENGKLNLIHKNQFLTYLKSLQYKTTQTKIELTVKRYRKKRSDNQNRYYWLCLNVIADELGYTPEEMHTTFKSMFLIDRSGKMPVIRSTTILDTAKFTKYMDFIAVKAGELGIILPDPNEYCN